MSENHLDQLEVQHEQEEQQEAGRYVSESPRRLRLNLPKDGKLPGSNAWLERYYAAGAVREKKPGVFDHLRSYGAWFTSVDEDPLTVIDGMSQTATLPAGFAVDEVVRAYTEGDFDESILFSDDTSDFGSAEGHPAAQAFADELRKHVPGLPHVTFVNSGAESCEKAFSLCRTYRDVDTRKKLLCFEGSFHGRTLLSLHGSFNPKKRAPFEIAGYEVTYAPFPLWDRPMDDEPNAPEGFMTAASDADRATLEAFANGDDALLAAEAKSLLFIDEALSQGIYFATAIEPMQSEGGDRYASARFFRALRLLTRKHDMPLIFDEVQSGFGLGGTFAWHSRFELVDKDGNPDYPDCVTFAKRAQVGVVMSAFEDKEPTPAHAASLVRGRIHAELMAGDEKWREVEAFSRTRLAKLAERYPELVSSPRATGYAAAFDLPSPAEMMQYVPQRFWRGVVVFAAGSQTIRYRFSTAFSTRELGIVFDAAEACLDWVKNNPGEKPPAWFNSRPNRVTKAVNSKLRVRLAEGAEADALMPDILRLEAQAYEEARRDPEAKLRMGFEKDGVAVVAEINEGDSWRLVGSALAAPLERIEGVDGPDRDAYRGANNTLYSMALTIDEAFRGHGLGRQLKEEQVRAARKLRDEEGGARYEFITGRNRVGDTDAMMHVNRVLGSDRVYCFEHQYGEEAKAAYYRMPVRGFGRRHVAHNLEKVSLSSGVARPLQDAPKSLQALDEQGALYGPAVNKITICNYLTPSVVRSAEWVAKATPNHPGLFLTSSKDECFDKSLRILRYHRKEAQIAIGFDGGYFGHTTAAARSLSCPTTHQAGPAYFDNFLRVTHPADDIDAAKQELSALVEKFDASAILGVFVEAVGERSGKVIPNEFWAFLNEFRSSTGVPVALSETASGCHRNGSGLFVADNVGFTPDVLFWWAGGQTGFVHTTESYFVAPALTMVSTWDGDELSMIRVHHQLRALRKMNASTLSDRLHKALDKAPSSGLGLYRIIHAGDKAQVCVDAAAKRGIHLRALVNGNVIVAPTFDVDEDLLSKLEEAMNEAFG